MVRMTSKFTLKPDIIVYAAVCNAFEKAERWRQTSRLLSALHHHSCEPDRALWNSAATACVAGRQWRDTLQIIREQLVTSAQVADAVAATAALQAATTGTRWSLALVLARPADADLPFYQAKLQAMQGQKEVVPDMDSMAGLLRAAGRRLAGMAAPALDLGMEVEAIEVLHGQGHLTEDLLAASRRLLAPASSALARLRSCSDDTAASTLQRQWGLGSVLSDEVLQTTDGSERCRHLGASRRWLAGARHQARACVSAAEDVSEPAPPSRPATRWLGCIAAGSLYKGADVLGLPSLAIRRWALGHRAASGGFVEEGRLLEVFVDHDRSQHAERRALLLLLQLLLQESVCETETMRVARTGLVPKRSPAQHMLPRRYW
ncbi:EMB2654 [Symbiodinium microadriaticum]|nr:EMB2654 [Symbiodinium microadriaticum]